MLSISTEQPKPVRKKGEILVKVEAVALAPGDVRVMKGHCDFFQSPKTFPYIPGGDLSGVIEEADPNSRFSKGDKIIAMFELPRPLNALAEFCSVPEKLVEFAPTSVGAPEASCLTSSAVAALRAVRKFVKVGSRVLVLGGSGGVGTFLVQLARNAGASYIASISTDADLISSLGADRAIDYTAENWFEIEEFKNKPFDIIFDLGVGRREAWEKAKSTKVLKNGWQGGKYCSLTGDEPLMKIHNASQAFAFFLKTLWRPTWTSIWRFVPRYIWYLDALTLEPGDLKELGQLVDDGKIRVILDPVSSSKLTAEAVKRGFHLMAKRKAHGKVVIEI